MDGSGPGSSTAVAVYVSCSRTGRALCDVKGEADRAPDLRLLVTQARPANARSCQLLLTPEAEGRYSISVAGLFILSSSGLLKGAC